MNRIEERPYVSKIETKNTFTDKTMGVFGIVNAIVFFSFCLSSSNFAGSLVSTAFQTYVWGTPCAVLLSLALGFFLVSVGCTLLYYLFPKVMAYTNAGFMLGASLFFVYTSFTERPMIPGNVFIGLLLVAVSVVFLICIVRNIEFVKAMIRVSSHVIVSNLKCMLFVYVSFMAFFVVFACIQVVCVAFGDMFGDLSLRLFDASTIFKIVYMLLFNLVFLMTVFNAFSVFYGKMTHMHMLKKACNDKRSVMVESLKRTCRSFGTIFIAGLLAGIVLALEQCNDAAQRRAFRRNQDGYMLIVLSIVSVVISLILHILHITIKEINRYCMAYNALFGTSYTKSMKNAFADVMSKKNTKLPYLVNFMASSPAILIMNAIVFKAIGSIDMFHTGIIKKYPTGHDNFWALAIGMCISQSIIYSMISQSVLTAIETIIYTDPGLIEKAYPANSKELSMLSTQA
ncbi:uncharacterized protein NEMAJ01_1614 [Nematocida major]|uniref:uncharacterized protein n=1 Tax=Nematocida major TaxID=1912982 RepID=UPI00200876B2|nr:uncharacterized protein NEMAJ01_1614 [Nematocida major]KAH9386718.1 hypothetical protein NEMAJ01_1614 [Nematocida major]